MHMLVSKLAALNVEKHRCRSRQILGGAKDFCPNFTKLARKTLQRKWPPKRNVYTLILSAIFAKSKHIQRFCEGIHTFCPNFSKYFARLFTKSKVLGVRLHPASYTSVEKYYIGCHGSTIKIWRFHGSLSQKGSRSVPSPRGALVGLSPPNKAPSPQIETWNTINKGSFG